MNINPPYNTWPFALGKASQETLQTAKQLIHSDDVDELEALEEMVENQLVSGTTPSGEGGDNLLMYAVQNASLHSFSAMLTALGEDASVGLNHQNWDGNTVWHVMALCLHDVEFLNSCGWFNEVHNVLNDLPSLSIDWSLRNTLHETALETARRLERNHLAEWLVMHGAGSESPSLGINAE